MGIRNHFAVGIMGVGALGVAACATAESSETRENVGETTQKIVGGAHVTPGRYPWMVQISLKGAPGPDGTRPWVHACGGALIAKRWVLTAAHCLHFEKDPLQAVYQPSDLQVTLGEHDLSNNEGTEVIATIAAGGVIPHEQFGASVDVRADIGLIKLAQDAPINDRIKIVRLTKGTDYVNSASYAGVGMWVSGWGSMYPALVTGAPAEPPTLKDLFANGVAPDAPQSNIPDSWSCRQYLAEKTFYNPGGSDPRTDAFCNVNPTAWDEVPGSTVPNFQSACFGDSGSPWIRQTNDGCVEEIGVHVDGDTNCWAYDLATSVAPYLPWIHSKVDGVYEAETMSHQTGGAHPDGWNIWDNGYISFNHASIGGQQQMTIRAQGQNGNGWPHMRVTVNGVDAYNVDVTTTAWTNYTFPFTAAAGNADVRIYLTNDLYVPSVTPAVDRNLFIDKATISDLGNDATCQRGASPSEVSTTLAVTSSWQDGYCVELRMNNTGPSAVAVWHAQIDLKSSTFDHGWGLSGGGTGLQTFTGFDWGKTIDPHSTRVVGFCGRRALNSGVLPTLLAWTPT